MSVIRTILWVDLTDGSTHRVEVLHGDQLRAELEAPKHGIPVDPRVAPTHTSTLWVWAALVRMGVCETGFQDFLPTVVAIGKSDQPVGDPVGPTQQGLPTGGP